MFVYLLLDNASPQKRTLNNSSPNIINSPVGKFFVEDEFNASHLLHNNKMISKSQPSISPTLHMKTDTIKKKLFVSQPSNSTQGKKSFFYIFHKYIIYLLCMTIKRTYYIIN